MTSFEQFAARCKMRHDYGDMIQVRYNHPNGDDFDTWVSGEEILQRLRSESAEERLRRLSKLDLNSLRQTADEIPERARDFAENSITERIANDVEDFLGDSVISESIADAIRDEGSPEGSAGSEQHHWRTYLQDPIFRAKVVELAWIQLEGSFPEEESNEEPDDWV
ncbi:MAG: hypothetical protein BMS9Abin02_0129 [Anaerolineae bacterium]|nr:MAG: hypothetical protein BMS9Abin02_0129 [Anaerolineae bacterium]